MAYLDLNWTSLWASTSYVSLQPRLRAPGTREPGFRNSLRDPSFDPISELIYPPAGEHLVPIRLTFRRASLANSIPQSELLATSVQILEVGYERE